MKKSILNLGKALHKTEQKKVNGGNNPHEFKCETESDCHEEPIAYCRKGICIYPYNI